MPSLSMCKFVIHTKNDVQNTCYTFGQCIFSIPHEKINEHSDFMMISGNLLVNDFVDIKIKNLEKSGQ